MEKVCSILPSDYIGHLDHICPISSLLKIPLYTCSKTIKKLIQSQYPDLRVIYKEENDLYFEVTEKMDTILSTLPRQILDLLFFFEETKTKKTLKKIWLPHGQSDKNNMGALINEDQMLVYGSKMKEMIEKPFQPHCLAIGNFRVHYYQHNRKFYDSLVQNTFMSITQQSNILYAPSFEDKNIESWIETLIKNKPRDITLYIKLHPNTLIHHLGHNLKYKYEKGDSIIFIEDFFPIYPLLQYMSVLFTDISSIGYDFLYFKRKMLFTRKENSPLHKCGSNANKSSPYNDLVNSNPSEQDDLYQKTFASLLLKNIM